MFVVVGPKTIAPHTHTLHSREVALQNQRTCDAPGNSEGKCDDDYWYHTMAKTRQGEGTRKHQRCIGEHTTRRQQPIGTSPSRTSSSSMVWSLWLPRRWRPSQQWTATLLPLSTLAQSAPVCVLALQGMSYPSPLRLHQQTHT